MTAATNRRDASMYELRPWGLVTVTGPDTFTFLQSLVSQDLDPVPDGDGAHSLLLQPQGKLTADFRLLRISPTEAWLDCEASVGPVLAAALARFRIRVAAEIADATPSSARLEVRGADSVAAIGEALGLRIAGDQHGHTAWRDARVVRADWPGVPGVDVVGPRATVEAARAAAAAAGVVVATHDEREAGRILAFVPRQGLDTDERTIPQEAFLDRDAVSFTKGCFVGQELVCRIDTRGHVNRFLRVLEVDGACPPPGAEVVVAEKVVGELTSVAPAATGAVALGMVRREVEPPASVEVRWPAGTAAARLVRSE